MAIHTGQVWQFSQKVFQIEVGLGHDDNCWFAEVLPKKVQATGEAGADDGQRKRQRNNRSAGTIKHLPNRADYRLTPYRNRLPVLPCYDPVYPLQRQLPPWLNPRRNPPPHRLAAGATPAATNAWKSRQADQQPPDKSHGPAGQPAAPGPPATDKGPR